MRSIIQCDVSIPELHQTMLITFTDRSPYTPSYWTKIRTVNTQSSNSNCFGVFFVLLTRASLAPWATSSLYIWKYCFLPALCSADSPTTTYSDRRLVSIHSEAREYLRRLVGRCSAWTTRLRITNSLSWRATWIIVTSRHKWGDRTCKSPRSPPPSSSSHSRQQDEGLSSRCCWLERLYPLARRQLCLLTKQERGELSRCHCILDYCWVSLARWPTNKDNSDDRADIRRRRCDYNCLARILPFAANASCSCSDSSTSLSCDDVITTWQLIRHRILRSVRLLYLFISHAVIAATLGCDLSLQQQSFLTHSP